ncbi:hypothetical protein ABC345_09865 [Shouchella sp. 1P09AA]|uniref:hypothetical protein n=1 Tax=unclassified Shouchella TaxID=2893065 RepID=UPI0035C159B7
MKERLKELEKSFRRLAENNREQSKKDLYQTVNESFYKEDIPHEALDELKTLSPDFQKGLFDGLAFSHEQVANYCQLVMETSNLINETVIHQLVHSMKSHRSLQEAKINSDESTYQGGFSQGIKAGFNSSIIEVQSKCNV